MSSFVASVLTQPASPTITRRGWSILLLFLDDGWDGCADLVTFGFLVECRGPILWRWQYLVGKTDFCHIHSPCVLNFGLGMRLALFLYFLFLFFFSRTNTLSDALNNCLKRRKKICVTSWPFCSLLNIMSAWIIRAMSDSYLPLLCFSLTLLKLFCPSAFNPASITTSSVLIGQDSPWCWFCNLFSSQTDHKYFFCLSVSPLSMTNRLHIAAETSVCHC